MAAPRPSHALTLRLLSWGKNQPLQTAVSGAPTRLLDTPLLADYVSEAGAAALRKSLGDAKVTVRCLRPGDSP